MSKLFTATAATAGISGVACIWTISAAVFDHWPTALVHATGSLTGAATLATIAIGARDHLARRIDSIAADAEARTEAARQHLTDQLAQSEQRIRQQLTDQLQHVLILFGHYVHDEERIAEHLVTLRAEGVVEPATPPTPTYATVTHLHRRN